MIEAITEYLQVCIVGLALSFLVCPDIEQKERQPLRELLFGICVLPIAPIVLLCIFFFGKDKND